MPYLEIYYPEDNISCAYWQSGKYNYDAAMTHEILISDYKKVINEVQTI